MNNQEKYQIGDRVLVKPQIFSLSDGFYHAHIKAIKEGFWGKKYLCTWRVDSDFGSYDTMGFIPERRIICKD